MAVPANRMGRLILHCAAALGILLPVAAQAQRNLRAKPKTPRALAVVEWPAKGAPRLVPVCILIDGQFYDAGIYKADPVPFALDPGNVYEVEHSGEPEGFFTISQAAQRSDNWFGIGRYSTLKALEEARQARQKKPSSPAPADSGPPRLTRGPEKEPQQPSAPPSPSPGGSAGAPPPNPSSGEGPPVLQKRPPSQPSAPPDTAAKPAAPPPGSDAEENEDPNRPRLRRGKPAEEIGTETLETPATAVSASAAPGSNAPGTAAIQNPAALLKVLPAISDAKGPQPRSFAFDWTPQEQNQITSGMEELARTTIAEYLKGRNDAAGPLENVVVKAFDLDLSNEAVFVLTATAGPAPAKPIRRGARGSRATGEPPAQTEPTPATYFVTVVARQDLEGHLRRIFRRVTDSRHLDAYARLELIDAVDADGDGRGELLFRAINDQTRAFVIYRAGVDNLDEMYNSGDLQR